MPIEGLVVLPFFLLAFASRRFPRTSGVLLLAAAAGSFWLFKVARAFSGDTGALFVLLAFALPLCAMGIALLSERRPVHGQVERV